MTNQHWTDEQFASWLAGIATPEMKQHLDACEACRTESEALLGSVAGFRTAVVTAAEQDGFRWTRLRHRIASSAIERPHGLRWAVSTGLALVAVSVGLLVAPHPKPTAAPHTSVEMSDDELLNEIHSDLSRSAPEALAPAQKLEQERNTILANVQSSKGESRND